MECYFGILADVNNSSVQDETYILTSDNLLYFYIFGKFQLKIIYAPIVFITDTEYYLVSGNTKDLITEQQFRQYCFPNRIIDIYDEIEIPQGEIGDKGETGNRGETGDIGDKGPTGTGISENMIELPYIGRSQNDSKDTIVEFVNGNLLPYDYRKTKNSIIEFGNTHNVKIQDFVVTKTKTIYIVGYFYEKLYIRRADGHIYYYTTSSPTIPNGVFIEILPNNLIGKVISIPSSVYSMLHSIVISKDDKIYVSGMFINNCAFYPAVYSNSIQYINRNYSMFVANITRNGFWSWVVEGRSTNQIVGITVKNTLAIDSNNNLYVGGYYFNSLNYTSDIIKPPTPLHGNGAYNIFLSKISNNGDWEWIQPINTRAGYSIGSTAIAIDKHDNIYLGGFCVLGQKTDVYLCKYSIADSIIEWEIYDNSVDNQKCTSIAAGEYVYISVQAYIDTGTKDAAGNIIWSTQGIIVPVTRTIIDFGSEMRIQDVFPESIHIDDDNNVYLSGFLRNLTEKTFNTPELLLPKTTNHLNRGFVAKLNWQHKWEWVSLSAGFSTYPCIYIDPDNTIYVLGANLVSDDLILAKIINYPILGLATGQLISNKNATVQFFRGTILVTSHTFVVGAYYIPKGKTFVKYDGYLSDGNVAVALTKNILLVNIY